MKVIVKVSPEDADGEEEMEIITTENENFVSFKVRGTWYDVSVADLYRATLPFMDSRAEYRQEQP